MATTYETFIADFYTDWYQCAQDWAQMTQDLNNAQVEHTAERYPEAQQFIINVLRHHDDARMHLMAMYQGGYPRYRIIKLWEMTNDRLNAVEAAGAPEITWQAIVAAWAKNDFEGRFWTISMIDRMRQIMWDEPFNINWAARPEEGGE